LDAAADIRATDLESHGLEGISFTLHHRKRRDHVTAPLLGRHSVHMALAGFAVGFQLGLAFEEIVAGYQQPNIQLRLLLVPAINGATLLDDTYNANPASSLAALNLLEELDARRKVAVFGDMLELGGFEHEGHRIVGDRASQVVDALYVMGERARIIGEQAMQAMPSLPVVFLDDKPGLLDALRDGLRDGDLVLIKGSRGIELETVVSELRNERDEE
ncbi:MAG: cyanophycin synthetase, partial [Thermomicrobiales bacterium]